jgi:lysophospholipase L1-like esterase
MTFGVSMKTSAIPNTTGPHYIMGGYDAATHTGWHLSINNSTSLNAGFTLSVTFSNGVTVSRQFKRGGANSRCPVTDGRWHTITVRLKLTSGASSSSGTMELLVDGIAYKVSSVWTDVAVNNTCGNLTDLATGYFTLGCRDVAGTPSAIVTVIYQDAYQCRGLLSDEEIINIIKAQTNTAGMGVADVLVEFDFTDLSKLYQDTAGTTPVTAVGQSVQRVNAKNGEAWYFTAASAATAPVWNGTEVEFSNYAGADGGATSARRGLQLNGHTTNALRQYRMSALAVMQCAATSLSGVTIPVVLSMTGTGSAWACGLFADQPAIATGTTGSIRTCATPANLDVAKTAPSWCVVGGSTGGNGSGAENDGSDFRFIVDDMSQGNAAGGGNATNGTYDAPLSGAGWIGCFNPQSEFGAANACRIRKLVILNRPLHNTVEVPNIRATAEQTMPYLRRSGRTWVVVAGDSISSSQYCDLPMGGYMALLPQSMHNRMTVVNASLGGQDSADLNTRINANKWKAGRPSGVKTLVIVNPLTNDIINTSKWVNQTTIQTRISTLITTIRSVFGEDCKILFILPRSNFSNNLSPPASTTACESFMVANPNLYTRLARSGLYSTDDGTHPNRDGHQELANIIRSDIVACVPSIVGAQGRGREARSRPLR